MGLAGIADVMAVLSEVVGLASMLAALMRCGRHTSFMPCGYSAPTFGKPRRIESRVEALRPAPNGWTIVLSKRNAKAMLFRIERRPMRGAGDGRV